MDDRAKHQIRHDIHQRLTDEDSISEMGWKHPILTNNKDMNDKMYTQQMTDLAHHAMNRIKELEHRLAMVKEDSDELQRFIIENGLNVAFKTKTQMCDEAWSHFANIDIACDLSNDEALKWKPFNK